MLEWKKAIRPLIRLGVKKIVLEQESYDRLMGECLVDSLNMSFIGNTSAKIVPTDQLMIYGIKIEKEDEL